MSARLTVGLSRLLGVGRRVRLSGTLYRLLVFLHTLCRLFFGRSGSGGLVDQVFHLDVLGSLGRLVCHGRDLEYGD